jgi:hypothetical protein
LLSLRLIDFAHEQRRQKAMMPNMINQYGPLRD